MKNNLNKIDEKIEQTFKTAFENFEVKPQSHNWDAISDKLFSSVVLTNSENEALEQGIEEISFDSLVKEHFDQFEMTPDPSIFDNVLNRTLDKAFLAKLANYEENPDEGNWEKIKRHIPLSLLIKNQLNVLTRIAAILVVLLLFTFLISYFNWPSSNNQYVNIDEEEETLPSKILDDNQANNENKANELASLNLTNSSVKDNLHSVDSDVNTHINAIEKESTSSSNSKENHNHYIVNNKVNSKESYAHVNVGNSINSNELKETKEIHVGTDHTSNGGNNDIIRTIVTTESLASLPLVSEYQIPTYASDKQQVADLEAYVKLLRSNGSLALDGLDDITSIADLAKSNLIMDFDNLETREIMAFRGWYMGIQGQINNSWILSKSIKNEIADQSRNSYVMDIGGAFGATTGFHFAPRWALEGGWYNARQGQKYKELLANGLSEKKVINATYNYFPVMVKYQALRMKSSWKLPVTLNYSMGIHYGHLKQATFVQQGEGIAFNDKLVKNEFGLNAGLEYHLYFDPKIYLSLGTQVAYGIDPKRFGANDSNPSNLKFGLNFGVYYRIVKD